MSNSEFIDSNEHEKDMILVEVAYATPEKQCILPLRVPAGTSAYDAVKLSSITKEFSGINIDQDPMGVFSRPLDGKGRPGPKEYQLSPGERVEIYRPLIIDPKRARLDRARNAKPPGGKPKK